MQASDLIVLTPAGTLDPALAIAAGRAGARGILDAGFATDRAQLTAALDRLARFAGGRFGVRLGRDAGRLVSSLLRTPAGRPTWVVLADADTPEHADTVRRFREAGVEVLFEAVSLAEGVRGEQLGADGIILKGHEAGGRVGADTAFVLVQKWKRHGDRGQGTGDRGQANPTVPFWVQGGIGPHTAAACLAAGACGVVLDSQVLLARESPLSDAARKRLAGLDGSETTVLGARLGEAYRRRGLTDVTVTIYPGARHEIFNEINKAKVLDDLVTWLDAKLVPSAKPE